MCRTIRRHSGIICSLLLIFICTCQTFAGIKPEFPLSLSENKRFLKDKNNKPFLIKEFSAWGILQVFSEADASAFMDSIQLRGFNTVMVSVISNDKNMAGNPPLWQGISPFHKQWDFSTPNETYFKHVDRVLKIAEEKGIFVMAVPIYLGYRGDPSQGWFDELINPNNDTVKTFTYGAFLGERYRNAKNLMWIAGGDNNADGKFFPYISNLIKGIKSKDPDHYWTGHFDCNLNVFWSTDNPLYASYMDIDGQYVWTESIMFEKGPQYVSEINQYKKGKMIIQLDQSYEATQPFYADNFNYQWMRRKVYDGLLSGCAGTSFCSGDTNNHCFTFKNWKPLMNTRGMADMSNCFKLFDALPWQNLVPDDTKDIILSGRGEFGSIDYVCAARSADKKYFVIYFPKGQGIVINAKNISGNNMRMHWYNPRNGRSLRIGSAETRERFGIVPPSEEDWVMVMDCDDGFQMPGL